MSRLSKERNLESMSVLSFPLGKEKEDNFMCALNFPLSKTKGFLFLLDMIKTQPFMQPGLEHNLQNLSRKNRFMLAHRLEDIPDKLAS